MKRILFLVALLSLSCSKDDKDNSCDCRAEYILPNQPGSFFVEGMPIDCETGDPTQDPPGNPDAWFVGCDD